MVVINLRNEIDRISSINPDLIVKKEDDSVSNVSKEVVNKTIVEKKKQFTSGQGKQMVQHYKKVFKEQVENAKKFQSNPETLIKSYIKAQLEWLEEQNDSIQMSGFGKVRAISDVQNLLNSQHLLTSLGDHQ